MFIIVNGKDLAFCHYTKSIRQYNISTWKIVFVWLVYLDHICIFWLGCPPLGNSCTKENMLRIGLRYQRCLASFLRALRLTFPMGKTCEMLFLPFCTCCQNWRAQSMSLFYHTFSRTDEDHISKKKRRWPVVSTLGRRMNFRTFQLMTSKPSRVAYNMATLRNLSNTFGSLLDKACLALMSTWLKSS